MAPGDEILTALYDGSTQRMLVRFRGALCLRTSLTLFVICRVGTRIYKIPLDDWDGEVEKIHCSAGEVGFGIILQYKATNEAKTT